MEIDNIPLEEIIPYEKNPRKNDKAVEIVAKSIKEFGFRVPIILDKNNVIIAGHTRLKAAQSLNLTEVPVIWADDLTEAQVKAFRIMDNKSTEYASWEFDLLKLELEGLREVDFDLAFTGFSEIELNKILPESIEEEELPNAEAPKYNVNQGDIYILGNHKLLCGDSTDSHTVSKLFESKGANMVLTDPPYNVDYSEKNKFLNSISRGNRNQTPIQNDNIEDFKQFLINYLKVIPYADYNTVYMFISGKEIANAINAFKDAGLYYSQDLKWVKNNHVLGRLDYNPKSENIVYGWMGKHEFYGGFQTDVIFEDKPLVSKEHPTMKPVELLKKLITHGSRENGIVYDGFGGSGSTLIACEQTNRICYMMELDPKYCSVIIERWENLTNKKAVKQGEKNA